MRLIRKTFTIRRVTNLAVTLALIAMVTMLVVSVKTLNNTDAASRSDQLNACRAEYRADIDAATATRADANDVLSVLNADILAAAVNRDPSVVPLIAKAKRASLTVEAAAQTARVANDAYAAAVTMSRTDPDGFLKTCARLHN